MIRAFGDSRVIPASENAKKKMKQLVTHGPFKEQRDVWRLGAAFGIATGKEKKDGKRSTFQNINSLDPDEIFASIMIGNYPELKSEERLKKLVNFAEWGIDELFRRHKIGTLNLTNLISK